MSREERDTARGVDFQVARNCRVDGGSWGRQLGGGEVNFGGQNCGMVIGWEIELRLIIQKSAVFSLVATDPTNRGCTLNYQSLQDLILDFPSDEFSRNIMISKCFH